MQDDAKQTEIAQKLPFGEGPVSLRELMEADLPKPKELVRGFLYEGETVALVARPKTGKTRLAQQLAIAVASGTDFLNQPISGAFPVLYVDLESHPAEARERLKRIGGTLLESVEDRLHLYCVENLGDSKIGLIGERLQKLKEMVRKTGARLVIIDTWRLISFGKENDAEDVVANLKALGTLRAETWASLTIVLIHHLRKADAKRGKFSPLRSDPQAWLDNISGSHALLAHTDASFGFERESKSDYYVLSGVRRNGPAPLFVLQSNGDSLKFGPLDDPEQMALALFTPGERDLWNDLPDTFTWSRAEEIAGGRKRLLHATLQKAQLNGLLEHEERQPYRKRAGPRKTVEQAA